MAQQGAARDELAPSPQTKRAKGGAHQLGKERVQSEAGQETEFAKVTLKIKADQAADKAFEGAETVADNEPLNIEMPPEGEKPLPQGQPALGALLKQNVFATQSVVAQPVAPAAANAVDVAAEQKGTPAMSVARTTSEVLALRHASDTGEAAGTAEKSSSAAFQHNAISMAATDRTAANPQLVRREGLAQTPDRTVVKTVREGGKESAPDLAPTAAPVPRETTKLQNAVQLAPQPKPEADDGAAPMVRVSRQETHLDNVRVGPGSTIADQVGKEIQLQLQQGGLTTSADRTSESQATRQASPADLQSSLSRPAQSDAVKTLTIQLRPDHLGTVTANLRLKGDVIHVELASAKSEVVHMIRQDRDVITEMLRSTGLMVNDDAVQVVELTQRTDGNSNNPSGDRERFASDLAADDEQRTFGQGEHSRSPEDGEAASRANRPSEHDGQTDERGGIFI